ncbi:TBXAS1 [Cordylochernes scorpioides]|uniref:TBXAS1 n=1 Tax=Cordylochernes scorpioides TaxID=51811 RepID=A0ABY6KDY7_9ARAC|nr:TBXAS1 [Cordylochernes scorpioides]
MSQHVSTDCHVRSYYFGLRPVLLVEDPELIKEIQIRNFHKFADRPRVFDLNTKPSPVEKQNMISNRGEKWKTVRSIISPSFAISKMKQMAPIINGAVEEFMDILAKKENTVVDLAPLYKGLTLDVIGRTAFGVQTQVQKNPDDLFFKAAQTLFQFTSLGVYLAALGAHMSHPKRTWDQYNGLCFSVVPEFGQVWMKLRELQVRFLNRGRNPGRVLENVCKEVIQARKNDPSITINQFEPKNLMKSPRHVQARRPDLLQMMVDTEVSEDQLRTTTADALVAEDDQTESPTAPSENGTQPSKENGKKLTEKEVVNNSMLFFLAGYETTSTALAFITCLLALHPEVQEKTRKEIQEVVKAESVGTLIHWEKNGITQFNGKVWPSPLPPPMILPYGIADIIVSPSQLCDLTQASVSGRAGLLRDPEAPVPGHDGEGKPEDLPAHLPTCGRRFVNREAAEDFRYGDIVIPKGANVQVPTYVLHRDPEFWEDPDTFNPESFVNECISVVSKHIHTWDVGRFSPENKGHINPIAFQSFGGGPRNCIGMRFAQMEAKFALVRLLLKYRVRPSADLQKVSPSNHLSIPAGLTWGVQNGIKVQIANAIIRPENGVPVILEPLL